MALPLGQKFVQRLRWLLEALHCHELVGVVVLLLGLLQDCKYEILFFKFEKVKKFNCQPMFGGGSKISVRWA